MSDQICFKCNHNRENHMPDKEGIRECDFPDCECKEFSQDKSV